MEIHELYKLYSGCNGISTDTRKIEENSMFFALKGDNFNANEFAIQALDKGAAFAVVDDLELKKLNNNKLIFVDDVLEALQELASFHRYHIGLPLIALTGSNGKTTSKELVHAVLQKHYNTIATIGNLNNHIGVPLTLLRLTEETDLAIVEMGANHQLEIEELCDIAQPDFGFITNFGFAHLEGFGGFEGVIKGKSEMYTYLEENKKQAFVNFDDPIQVEKTQNIKRFGFTLENNPLANIHFKNAQAQPMACLEVNNTTIKSNLTGVYNLPNIAIAISVGLFFNIPIETIKEAIEAYVPQNNRSQWVAIKTNKILLDAYNANPSSILVAIQNFKQLEETNKLMILGDMFELGNETEKEHERIIKEAINTNIKAILVGSHFYNAQIENSQLVYFKQIEDVFAYIAKENYEDHLILIKGSRGMALERILDKMYS